MSQSAGDRQHEATPLRRARASQEGDFARSFELAIALQVLGSVLAVYLFASGVGGTVKQVANQNLMFDEVVSMSPQLVLERFQTGLWACVWALVPLMVCSWLVVVASHWLQTGVVWLPHKAAPDPARISVLQMVRQLFSLQTLSVLLIGVPKCLMAVAIAVGSCWMHRESILSLVYLPTDQMIGVLLQVFTEITFYVGLLLLVSSAADYWVRRISFLSRIRMTDAELREESRAQDGDPVINSQRKLLFRR